MDTPNTALTKFADLQSKPRLDHFLDAEYPGSSGTPYFDPDAKYTQYAAELEESLALHQAELTSLRDEQSYTISDEPFEPPVDTPSEPPRKRAYNPITEETSTQRQLSARYHKIALMIVQGFRNTEIAQSVGLDPQSISIARRNPLIAHFVTELRKQAAAQVVNANAALQAAALDAANFKLQLVHGEVDGIKVPLEIREKAASDILNRVGLVPTTRVDTRLAVGIGIVPGSILSNIREAVLNRTQAEIIDPDEEAA